MRRASQLIITSVKESRHCITRSAAKDTHVEHCAIFYTPLYAHPFSSIPDNRSSAPPSAAVDDDDSSPSVSESNPSTSSSSSIDTKHRYIHTLVYID
jgi:hypothetical protein